MTTRGDDLNTLTPGMPILYGGNRVTHVTAELAADFAAGDRLFVVQSSGDLLHVPASVAAAVTAQVDAAADAFVQLRSVPPAQIQDFFNRFAAALEDDDVWARIVTANEEDVARAIELGRSTTRLQLSANVREDMAGGLRGWAEYMAQGKSTVIDQVTHGTWSVDIVEAPLGVIAFVFEGRPNVFADAAGVLATGNTAVLRIGGDALSTAQAIVDHALEPALSTAGLPSGCLSLVPVRDRSAGWALFNETRLALAVVRGSGKAVAQLSSVARQSGIPVSAHGTGGAWVVADSAADAERLQAVVENSLDRKVCNTLNVAVVTADRATELIPVILAGADAAAVKRSGTARVHVAESSVAYFDQDGFTRQIPVERADGIHQEPRFTTIPVDQLGTEWEWENTPELSIVVVADLDEAISLYNDYSPQFVASLISDDEAAHLTFLAGANAPFVGDGFTRWVDGQYALNQPELGLSNWENGRLLARGGVLTGADLTTRRLIARHEDAGQHR